MFLFKVQRGTPPCLIHKPVLSETCCHFFLFFFHNACLARERVFLKCTISSSLAAKILHHLLRDEGLLRKRYLPPA